MCEYSKTCRYRQVLKKIGVKMSLSDDAFLDRCTTPDKIYTRRIDRSDAYALKGIVFFGERGGIKHWSRDTRTSTTHDDGDAGRSDGAGNLLVSYGESIA